MIWTWLCEHYRNCARVIGTLERYALAASLLAIAAGCINAYMDTWFNDVAAAIAFFTGGISLSASYFAPQVLSAYGNTRAMMADVREITQDKIRQAFQQAGRKVDETIAECNRQMDQINPERQAAMIADELRKTLKVMRERGEIPKGMVIEVRPPPEEERVVH